MVFSSFPVFVDPPSWPQQQLNPEPGGGVAELTSNDHHTPQPPLPPLPPAAASTGSDRPSSMVDRARLAKIPMPEPGLKCPRCESTNTKFCYFNNYNLSQPRHFCKTCRRYWTRGGALRNVPVGGGCRRSNKKSKGGKKSKSPAAAATSSSITSSGYVDTITTASADIITGHSMTPLGSSNLYPFLSSMHNLNDLYVPSNLGLSNFETIRKIGSIDTEFQVGNANVADDQQWRSLHQFAFIGNNHNLQTSPQVKFYQLEGVKMEGINISQSSNASTNVGSGILGISQYIQGTDTGTGTGTGTGNNAWSTSDLSHGFSSSTTTHHLL